MRSTLAGGAYATRTLHVASCPDGKEKSRDLFRIPFPAIGPRYTSFADTIVNVECALLERVFYHEIGGVFTPPFIPNVGVVPNALGSFRQRLKQLAAPLTPVSTLDFPGLYYSGQRFKLYDNAARRVAITGPLRKHSYLATFLKHEKIPLVAKRAVPRVIQPRNPQYNVCLGRYLRQLEHILYHDIARVFGRPTIMKGYNAAETGRLFAAEWSRYHDAAGVGLDASRFDQHINVELLKWEHLIYELYYPGCEELRRLLSWQLRSKGFVRVPGYRVKYTVEGGRCSGDMNTAMGNCLVMCACVYALCAKLGLVHASGETMVSVFNNGDDCYLVGERSNIQLIAAAVPSTFAALGLIMKVEPVVDKLEQVVFCQTQPVYDGVSWRMVRDPRVCMSKDLYVMDRKCATYHLSTQMHAIGQCGLSLTGGLPVFQEYYMALTRNGRPGRAVDHNFLESGFWRLSRGMRESYRPVTVEARVSFARAFGIMPDLQCALEDTYRSLTVTNFKLGYGEPWEMPI